MVWKIYFWILLLYLLMAYALIFIGTPTISDVLDVIISFTALTGLFSYAYKKKIFTPKFWSLILMVIIFWDLIYNLLLSGYLGVAQDLGEEIEASPSGILVSLVFVVPEYIALYLLAFKSSELWRR